MPAIRLLDRSVAELIAAGEVVERPASIVKELCENAIDAGATRIQVEIKNGGVRLIRITDNGCGIAFDEMPTAFMRHATSKIATAEDLDAILSLGFRGEALASISAMAKVEMLSRRPNDDMGGRYRTEGGDELLHEPAGSPVGTTVVVRDLFYNTPARMKFLKKDTTEGAAVSQVVERLALINCGVSFSYMRDGKRMFTTPGDGLLLSSVRTVLGNEFASSLIPVHSGVGDITVEGFITKPAHARASRGMQHFYLNGRYIQSKLLTGALEEAYRHTLMGGKFPGCVLNIRMRPGAVDVNVHPAKTEVRFSDEKSVYQALYSACKETVASGERPVAQVPKTNIFSLRDFDHVKDQLVIQPAAHRDLPQHEQTQNPGKDPATYGPERRSTFEAPEQTDPNDVVPQPPQVLMKPVETPIEPALPGTVLRSPAPSDQLPYSQPDSAPATQPEPIDFRVIGELFGTYILAEAGETFYLIDKHAAHERHLYNRLTDETQLPERQALLAPVAVSLSKREYAAAVENLGALGAMGFAAEDFGEGTLLVREIPLIMAGIDIAAVVTEMAAALADSRRDITPDYLSELLASVACRGAVMGGDRSQGSELAFIADLVLNGGITHCPHGRPTCHTYTKREIERMFGRLA